MTDLNDVVEGLKYRVAQCPGLGVYSVGEAGVFPAAFVPPPAIPEYENDLDSGSYTALFEIGVFSGRTPETLPLLTDYVDPRSVRSIARAVAADPTLGGLNVSARATGHRGLEAEEVAAYQAWGHAVAVIVFVS